MNEKEKQVQQQHGKTPSNGQGRPVDHHGHPQDLGRPVVPHRSSAHNMTRCTKDR